MSKPFKQNMCLFLAVQFFLFQFASVCWAKKVEDYDPNKISVAILPYPSSDQDRSFIEESADTMRERLKVISHFRVVPKNTVQEIVGYHADYVMQDNTMTSAEHYLGLAKTHWFGRQYDESLATVEVAIKSFRNQPEKGDLLVDALLTKAMVLKETKNFDESKKVFEEALAINPSLTMEGLPITGRSLRVFNQTRQEVLERLSGNLEVTTDPPAATVYLNGIKKGVTPLKLTDLTQGSYLLSVEASHYQPIHKSVYVTANTTQFINHKLYWVSGRSRSGFSEMGAPTKTDNVLQKEIKLATRVGETLKVDKVVLVSSERKGNKPMLVVRTIDTALQASHNPLGMSFEEYLHNKVMANEQLTKDLKKQAQINVMNNPEEYLEPDLGDVRVLRRKRGFLKSPFFYSMMGAFIGGAIGATVGILVTRDSGTGSDTTDEGAVEIEFQ